ncbi:TolC family protein [Gemmatimonas sp.]|uniref:TolC family protein n=1 Tax=Gemmatimonas sp. TaxID=1962908 RepID=UPI0022C45B18|nr:TolC family protein [Gemmatimonas sp.]MCZ8204321.1 TolC family protein [Gemmatimonas sp.]
MSAPPVSAQDGLPSGARPELLLLREAYAAALRIDPAVRAAKEAAAAASARERQAAALPNPSLAYGREQTSRPGQSNAQDIAQVEWPLDVAGQRSARIAAARFRREAAEARVATAVQALEGDVVQAYVEAMTATQRASLADAAFRTTSEAQRVSDERVRAGDAAMYVGRRLRLEAGRYAARRAEAAALARAARERLALLTGLPAERITVPAVSAGDSSGTAFSALLSTVVSESMVAVMASDVSGDSLVARAHAERADVRTAQREAQAALADARLASRERVPMPALSAGYKGEQIQSGINARGVSLAGFVAGFSLPLPLLDRRAASTAAARATARQSDAEVEGAKRRVAREVLEALNAVRGAEAERALLQPFVGDESRLALRAVQAAFAEGEITLTEWLEAVRAWQETEVTLLTLTTSIALRRVELARAVGLSLFPLTESSR